MCVDVDRGKHPFWDLLLANRSLHSRSSREGQGLQCHCYHACRRGKSQVGRSMDEFLGNFEPREGKTWSTSVYHVHPVIMQYAFPSFWGTPTQFVYSSCGSSAFAFFCAASGQDCSFAERIVAFAAVSWTSRGIPQCICRSCFKSNTFCITHQLQVRMNRGCLQWNQRDTSGSWWFYQCFIVTLKPLRCKVLRRRTLHNSTNKHPSIATRLKAFSSVDPFVLFIGWRSVGWCLDYVTPMSSSPEMRLGALAIPAIDTSVTMSCKPRVTTENQMRYPRHIFDCTFVGCSVEWCAETTQVTHEEQDLLERLCGLGLGYFKYSADIFSAVS